MKESRLKRRLRRIARWHAIFSVALFALYVALSAIYSPEFLLADIRAKFRAFADTITITATVLAPPVMPVVTATPACDTTTGTLSVDLDWADDPGTEEWDIDRDSLPLVSGLTASEWSDTAVATSTTYSYVVTAYGPMGPGFAVSDPAVATTPASCEIALPAPTVSVTAFDGRGIGSYDGTPETTDRDPLFEETTNIQDAIVTFLINDTVVISAVGTANAGGYFSWRPPVDLSRDTHTLFVTVTDPNDAARTASTSFVFRIVRPDEDEDDEDDGGSGDVAPSVPDRLSPVSPIESVRPSEPPVDFSLSLTDPEIMQGAPLPVSLTIVRLDDRFDGTDAVIRYSVVDVSGNEKASLLENVVLGVGRTYVSAITPPKFLAAGDYRVRAELLVGSYDVSREAAFRVLPLPVLDFGGGTTVTYPELLSALGRIAVWVFLLLLLWILLFFREYWLYLHSIRHITERHLARIGLFGGRSAAR